MKVRNVLVFPAGTEIGLEIYQALQYCKEVRLFAAGTPDVNHAKFAFPDYYVLPAVTEPGWLQQLQALCVAHDIHYIFPAYDDVIVALAQHRSAIPAVILAPDANTCEVTRSKSRTYAALKGIVKIPRIFVATGVTDFPVFVKPDKGQGSFCAQVVEGPADLQAALRSTPAPLVCEYLPGDEFTVDCFSDRDHGLLFAGARIRRRVRNGIAVNTVQVPLPEAQEMARSIGAALQLRGAWFFQLRRDAEGVLTLLEVGPRIAGSMSTHRASGVNFALLSIFEHERLALHILVNPGTVEVDRALRNRYRHQIAYDTVYVDLDDTLIFRGTVNLLVASLVFHSLNEGKKVKLITRHNDNVGQTLARYRLGGLFDEVIHLRPGTSKSTYITEPGAILVDDSFSERLEVWRSRGIPTFDCSMVEMLLEGREDAEAPCPKALETPASLQRIA